VPAADDVRRTAITFASGRHRDPVRLTPGTARLLDRYSDRHLGIITNGPADGQVRKVRRAGLGALVHAVVASTAAGVGEPDPALVGMCLDLLGARDSRVLVIGDSLERDVQLAVNSGCPAVWIRGDQPGPVPDGVVAVPGPEDVADAITRLKAQ
jgi:putative hydrolase of the HAD superfamily